MAKQLGQQSLVLLSPALSQKVPAVLGFLKDAGLHVDDTISLVLTPMQAERMLRAMLGVSHEDPVRPPPGKLHHGTTLDAVSMTQELAQHAAAIGHGEHPSALTVERYSDAACTFIKVSAVDPRVDVVAYTSEVVGPEDLFLARGRRTCLRYVFAAGSDGVIQLFAPGDAGAAKKAASLLREYQIRATAAGSSMTATAAAMNTTTISGSAGLGRTGELALSQRLGASVRPSATVTLHRRSHLVDLDVLFSFVFPPGQQHPRSTGRLILAALYGPLTPEGGLCGGRYNGRLLTEREIETMIEEVNRDDILSVYTHGSVLGNISEVLIDVRAASRKMPNMSRQQISDMLSDLPCDTRGRISFADFQARVLSARLGRIAELGKLFPDVISKVDAEMLRTRIAPPPPLHGRGKLSHSMATTAGVQPTATRTFGRSLSTGTQRIVAAKSAPMGPLGASALYAGIDVKRKMGPVEEFRTLESLVHRNAHKSVDIAEATSPRASASVQANSKIIRADVPSSLDGFDRYGAYTLHKQPGSAIPGALSRLDLWKGTRIL